MNHVDNEVRWLYELYPQQPMAELTDVLKRGHEAAESCHICLKSFDDRDNRKVRDQCHYTGLYRGAVHNDCNMKYKIPDFVPIAFYNRLKKDDIGVIAKNKEKYISFNVPISVKLAGITDKNGKEIVKKVKLRFVDSFFRFMPSSLDKLASNLDGGQ